jgi:glycosyltransferase involved in cell wall biosynthesis
MLHVAQVGYFIDPLQREPERLLADWPSLVDVAQAAAGANVRVSVIQASAVAGELARDRVTFHFVPPERGSMARSEAFYRLLHRLAVDALHVHGLDFPSEVRTTALRMPETPILLQDHASRVPRIWRRWRWRQAAPAIGGVAFCAREQARPFEQARLFGPQTQFYEIPESTARFSPGEREAARQATGLDGDPCLLWVGHLNENKDPLTVLDGIAKAVPSLPGLKLWCCFGSAPLQNEVSRRISADPLLAPRVHLLGRVPHATIESLMRAADFFVLGSHREGSGYSVLEALACGLPPVVTDIPSFHALTGRGAIGKLWPCGDADGLCASLLEIVRQPWGALRHAARAHFEAELSFQAVGRKLASAYGDLVERSSPRSSPMARAS